VWFLPVVCGFFFSSLKLGHLQLHLTVCLYKERHFNFCVWSHLTKNIDKWHVGIIE
jgi:hypothetical protein